MGERVSRETQPDLTDEQWIVLAVLMKAHEKGQPYVTRQELMTAPVPLEVQLRLTMAALTLPTELATWPSHNVCCITETGVTLCRHKFGKRAPAEMAKVADAVICLPDMTKENAP